MQFEIKNRYTWEIPFTAEIECEDNESISIKLGLAVKYAIKRGADLSGADLGGADLRGADLRGAHIRGAHIRGADLRAADLSGAFLNGAHIRGADLRGADLNGAYLNGADLNGAHLRGADLSGADLNGADLGDEWIIQGPIRSDGYGFFLQKLKEDAEPMVNAGCRYLTIPEAREHWTETRAGTPLGDETFAILDFLERTAAIRGLLPQKSQEAA